MHRDSQTLIDVAQHIAIGHEHFFQGAVRVIGGHVEGPQVLPNLKACRFRGGHETADALGAAILARMSREHQHMAGLMQAGGPHFFAG